MNLWTIQGWLYESLFSLTPHRRLVEETAAYVNQTDGLVLDAGCGTGRLAMSTKAKVHGIDFSETMLRVARRRDQRVMQADLDKPLPFGDGTFARVVSLNVLYTLPRPDSTVKELARVLEKGGELVLATPSSSKLVPLVTEHFRTATAMQNLALMINLPRLVAWMVVLAIRGLFSHSHFTFLSAKELQAMVEAAGLKVVSIRPCYAGIDLKIVAIKEE